MTPEQYEDYKDKITKIIRMFFPKAKIYLFGSRARGDFKENSDFDIAIDIGSRMPIQQHAQIMGLLEALYIPYTVDVIDINAVSDEIKHNVLNEGILWN